MVIGNKLPVPDFTAQGYAVTQLLGQNHQGGRLTWLGHPLGEPEQRVVIKQFCFARGENWSAYEAYLQEIALLQGLKHPSIPAYITSFETPDGFCMVQVYVEADNLTVPRVWQPEQVKLVAQGVLDILVYLQSRPQPVLHRDIKPENILMDRQQRVYLIDFGFGRLGIGEVSGSSVLKGTPGYIPPEQLSRPTKASDLYALGATLINLITGRSILELLDPEDPYKIQFQALVRESGYSQRFIHWLELMVKPKLSERFPDAATALETLQALAVGAVPDCRLVYRGQEYDLASRPVVICLKADKLNQKLAQELTLVNSVPEVRLEGRWEVGPGNEWIRFLDPEIRGNSTCTLLVDTSSLQANSTYERRLRVHLKDTAVSRELWLQVTTPSLPRAPRLPLLWLLLLLLAGSLLPLMTLVPEQVSLLQALKDHLIRQIWTWGW